MHKLIDKNITLEVCPTSNLKIGVIKGTQELKRILRTFFTTGVSFTINTDGPELLDTTIKKGISLLLDNDIL